MSAFIGALRVTLGIDTAEFQEGIKSAQDEMKRVGSQMQAAGKAMSLAVTAPITGFGALIIKTAGDFEASMNRVDAALGASSAEIAQLRDMAKELGATTQFSASQAADAIEMLAKNGLNASQILGGALEASLLLSAASGGDLSASADLATDVMLNFGKTADDLGGVVDGVTGVMLASKFGFDDYRLALAQAGGVAGGLGVTLEDFNATIAATSARFASGSDAGTSFKTFLQRLVPSSLAAEGHIKNLGLEFFDAQGNMRSMAEIAETLKVGMAGLSDEAKNEALQDIFGTDAIRTAIGLMGEGAAGIERLNAAISDASAQEQADARMKGWNGVVKEITSSFEALQIAIGESGLLEWATQAGQAVRGWIAALAETNPEILKWGTVVAAAAAAIGPLLVGLGLALTAFAAVSAPIWGAIAAVSALSAVILYFWDDIQPFVTGFAKAISEAVGPSVTAAIASLTESFRTIKEAISGAFSIDLNGTAFSQSMQILLDFLATRVVTGVQLALNTITTAVRVFSETVTAIAALFQGDFQGAFDAVMRAATAFKDGFVSMIEIVLGDVRGFATQLLDIFRAIPGQMLEIGRNIMTGLLNGARESWESVKSTLSGYGSSIRSFFTDPLGINSPSKVMHEVGMNIMQGLDNGMNSMAGGVQMTAQSLSQNIVGAFGSIIDGTKSVKQAIGDMLKTIANAMLNSALRRLLGGFGGAGGGFLGGLLGGVGKLFGFAQGGSFQVGGAGGIDSQLVAFRASPNETVSITKPGQERHGSMQVVRVVTEASPYFDTRVERVSSDVSARTTQAGIGQYDRAAAASMQDKRGRGIR